MCGRQSGCRCHDARFVANPAFQNGGAPGNMAECFGALDGDGGPDSQVLVGLQIKVSNNVDRPHCVRYQTQKEFEFEAQPTLAAA